MPHLTEVVDDIAFIKSMHTMHPNHEPALFMIQSGRIIPGRATMGSWIAYGLGTENQNLPAYVVLDDPLGLPVNGPQNWQAGFLPPVYQGTRIRSTGSPILNLAPEVPESSEVVQASRDLLARLDQIHKNNRPNQLQLDARIASYELAAKLQMSATDALDINKESKETLDMYGVGQEPTDSYARRCIMARRLIERGVRFVQLYINSQIWDNHTYLARDLKAASARTDKPVAALVKDLKQRGLAEGYPGDLGRRIWAHADCPDGERNGDGRTGPQSQRVHDLDGGRWRKAGNRVRHDRRTWPSSSREQSQCNRLACNHTAFAGDGLRETRLRPEWAQR
jgi:hypothetical protein